MTDGRQAPAVPETAEPERGVVGTPDVPGPSPEAVELEDGAADRTADAADAPDADAPGADAPDAAPLAPTAEADDDVPGPDADPTAPDAPAVDADADAPADHADLASESLDDPDDDAPAAGADTAPREATADADAPAADAGADADAASGEADVPAADAGATAPEGEAGAAAPAADADPTAPEADGEAGAPAADADPTTPEPAKDTEAATDAGADTTAPEASAPAAAESTSAAAATPPPPPADGTPPPPPPADDAPAAWQPRPWEAPTVVIPPAALDDDVPAYEPVTASSAGATVPTRLSRLDRTDPLRSPDAVDEPGTTAAVTGGVGGVAAGAAAAAAAPPAPPAPPASTSSPARAGTAAETRVLPATAAAARAGSGRAPETAAPERPSSPMDAFPDEPHRNRRWPRVLGIAAAVLVVLAGLYVGALWLWADRVAPGTTVAGVELGGLTSEEAEATLVESLASATSEPLPVSAGDNRTTVDPVAAGLELDASATVDGLTGFDLTPQRLWEQLFGAGAAEPVTRVDEDALGAAVEDVAAALDVAPVDGSVLFVDGAPQTTDAVEGSAVDPDAAAEVIRDGWLTAARPLELPTEVAEPAVGQAEVERVVAEVARPLVAAPVTVAVADQLVELPPDVVAAAASFVPEDGELRLQLDGPALVEAVTARTTNLLTSPADGSFAFQNGAPVIVPGTPGTTLDPEALADAVAAAGTGQDRTARVELVEVAPAESTAELEALGIVEVVSEFSTPLTAEPRRTRNIANGAEKINGTLVRPGETFSLTEALGPVDAAHGFVQAGAIVNGEHIDAWGGGLSQLSTTTYNAAFFAGFEDVEHHPHSEWFARYPEGREATIFTGSLDMRWKNDTPYGALVQAWVEGGRTWVRIWGTKYWEVQESTSGRSGVVAPTTVYSQSPTCEPQSAGNPGFTVTVTRRLLLQGVEQSTEQWTTRYKPQNQVICGAPPTG